MLPGVFPINAPTPTPTSNYLAKMDHNQQSIANAVSQIAAAVARSNDGPRWLAEELASHNLTIPQHITEAELRDSRDHNARLQEQLQGEMEAVGELRSKCEKLREEKRLLEDECSKLSTSLRTVRAESLNKPKLKKK